MKCFNKSKVTPCGECFSDTVDDFNFNITIDRNNITAKESIDGWIIETPEAIYEASKECEIDNIAGKILKAPIDIKELYSDSNYGWFMYFPLSLELDITRRCNFKCIHCNRSSAAEIDEELSFDVIENIARQCCELGIRQVQILGGEPIVHPNFKEICQCFKYYGADKMFTSSNGWFLDYNNIDTYKQYFQTVQISLHSLNPNKHDLITAKHGAWAKASNAILALGNANVNTIISMSVMHDNMEEIEHMVDFAEKSGARAIRFLALQEVGRGKGLSALTNAELESSGRIINSLQCQHRNIRILSAGFPDVVRPEKQFNFYGCAAGRTLMAIKASGDVSCCSIVEQTNSNIQNDSIFKIWHNEEFRKLRFLHNCSCQFASRCGGKCKSNRLDAYGSYCK